MNEENAGILERIRALEEKHLSAIQGCLIGGAVGDALGYPVEFKSREEILHRYGSEGIQNYDLDFETGEALISDDTQMTLFTANGLLVGYTRGAMRGVMGAPESYVYSAYRNWHHCQCRMSLPRDNCSWLSDVPEMHSRRAPGSTCMQALAADDCGTIEEPINNSKGCGGVMRVAPVALFFKNDGDLLQTDLLGAKIAALTHGHPLGYISAAALVHIVSRAAFGGCRYDDGLYGVVRECGETLAEIFPEHGHVRRMQEILSQAAELSRNELADADNIRSIGQGWTGEEALGIALYCCLKYPDDFSRAVIAAVNHSGDSDSTGAIAGNIMGALLGMEAIEEKWLRCLEMKNVILEVAGDLCDECQMREYGSYRDPDWERKYIHMKWR